MTRPRFSFRPNLQNEEHRRAWETLQTVPEGQKSAFLVRANLQSVRHEALEDSLRRVLREERQAVPSQPAGEPEGTVPQEMLGFLSSLLGDDE